MRLFLPLELLLLIASATNAQRFLFIFGDSLSATGFKINGTHPSASNPLGNPPYPGKTTDNGANWVGILVKASPYNTLAYNFAVSGATVDNSITYVSRKIPSITNQTTDFLEHLSPPPQYAQWNATNSVVCVWIGVNDIDTTYLENQTAVDMVDQVAYFNQLQRLYNAGIRRFLLFKVSPIYRDPLWNSAAYIADKSLAISDVNTWNALLATKVSAFASACTGCTVDIFDPTPVFDNILDNPTAYGAPNSSCYNSDGTSCLWWDGQHPGQAIQKAVGQAVYTKLGEMGFYGANTTSPNATTSATASGSSSTASGSSSAKPATSSSPAQRKGARAGTLMPLVAVAAWVFT